MEQTKKALDILRRMYKRTELERRGCSDPVFAEVHRNRMNALAWGILALNTHIEKPVLTAEEEEDGAIYYKKILCPTCDANLQYHTQPNYCPGCGQKLDWSEVL